MVGGRSGFGGSSSRRVTFVGVTPRGVLAGTHLGPRAVAALAHKAGFRDDHLFEAIAVCGAESWLFTEAHNDNKDASGNILSRDVGLWEINIPASEIGTAAETALYDPQTNADAAFKMWSARGWEPWVAFTSGAWLHDTYTIWAAMGVANRWAEIHVLAAKDAGLTPQTHTPWVSLPNMRDLYPKVELG